MDTTEQSGTSAPFAWQMSGLTDVGLRRESNEDCIHVDEKLGLVILADGMGGHQGGEVASAMAITAIRETIEASALRESGQSPWQGRSSAQLQELLAEAVQKANHRIFALAEADARYEGMGTTVVVALCTGQHLVYGHAGDSRLYRCQSGQLQQMSRDHSLVNELVDKGFYTEEQARQSARKNVITRALGTAENVQLDCAVTELLTGERYLLCSDGLSDLCSNSEMLALLQAHESPQVCCQALIDAANANGGRDNISVILLDILPASSAARLRRSLQRLFKV
ncbi:MAG: hypothetical protein RLZZ385_2120 [Pseudomonadota bacterium]|jgi:protein phosphatase